MALNEEELNLVKELLMDSLGKAEKSMEQMLKIRVKSELLDYGYGPLGKIQELDPLGRFKVHLVKVAFKGEIKGAFYFVINGHEVDLINRVCLPESVNSVNNSKTKMMKHGFMTEIENLIASLSLTEISDSLGVQLLGEVPEIHVMHGEEINDYLYAENDINNTAFFVKSALSGVAVNISPYFLWMLDQNFVDQLKLNIVT